MYQHQGPIRFTQAPSTRHYASYMQPNSSCPNTHGLRFRENVLLIVDPYALSAPLGPLLPLANSLGLTHEGLHWVYKKELTHTSWAHPHGPSTWPKSRPDLSKADAELRLASTEFWVLLSSTQGPEARAELASMKRLLDTPWWLTCLVGSGACSATYETFLRGRFITSAHVAFHQRLGNIFACPSPD